MTKHKRNRGSRNASPMIKSFGDIGGACAIWNLAFQRFFRPNPCLDTAIWIIDAAFGDFKIVPIRANDADPGELPDSPDQSVSFSVCSYNPDKITRQFAQIPPGPTRDRAMTRENERVVRLLTPTIKKSFRRTLDSEDYCNEFNERRLGVYRTDVGSHSTLADCVWLAGAKTLGSARKKSSMPNRLRSFAARHDFDPEDLFEARDGKLTAVCLLSYSRKVTEGFVRGLESLKEIFEAYKPKYLRVLRDPSIGPLNVSISDSQLDRILATMGTAKLVEYSDVQREKYYRDAEARYLAGKDHAWLN